MDEASKVIYKIKSHYRSGDANIGQDFFLPCMTYCSSYKRAVGFFSSSALITWSSILPKLVTGDKAIIKLLISPHLSEADKSALEQIVEPEKRDEFIQKWISAIILEAAKYAETPSDIDLRMKLFLWLVATERLELRIAFPEHVDDPGLFHEKIGVFEFPWGQKVAFTGSANESIMGHTHNYESIDVYRSWVDADVERVQIKSSQFEDAWSGKAYGLRTLPLSKDIMSRIKTSAPKVNPIEGNEGPIPTTPRPVVLDKWRHQDEAMAEFLKRERGILEMATGTGKTRTALRICDYLIRNNQISTIIISTDGNDLLKQWYRELLQFVRKLPNKYAIIRHFEDNHEIERFLFNANQRILLVSRMALPKALHELDKQRAKETILIHDEVHGLGSPSNRRDLAGLSDNIRFRLGLSATPEREYDDDGNKFIEEHIGPVIYRFELDDAIRRGILAPFRYYPLEYEIDREDRERIKSVYARASARKKEDNPMSKEELWTDLAFVYKTSKAKLPIFENFIARYPTLLTRCIIFVETKEYGDEVLDIVHKHNYAFHTYYAEDDSEILGRFASDQIKLLITCHRISEGIDIRSLETVILFSSARARLETIQRIGRCLRTDPSAPNKVSNIIDFVRKGGGEEDDSTTDHEREQWLSELAKITPEVT